MTKPKPTTLEPKDQPSVMAYRLGLLEETVKTGFREQTEYIKKLSEGFVTEKRLVEAIKEAEEEHQRLQTAIDNITINRRWWIRTVLSALLVGATIGAALIGLIALHIRVHTG